MIPPGNGSQKLHKLDQHACKRALQRLRFRHPRSCCKSLCCATMASSTSGSALDEIFADKQLFEAHFSFSCEEVVLDSDESDLEVDLSEDDSDGGNGISLQMNIN